ncbi:Por secretion system C-terminal sorting domain-containing protein [Flexibacter flexilis DSM 6793]|uniref:Por secretion system C-terminal sorting domain-containing protein n=1 Tax=Flexibacter flexilis DSM 6793 TaxID=927664 RepID=A0A1I1D8U3_9BACT|nr:T9SS type A sorting domain-containing protein [Flexibacter flexilis]SFB70802.1 Por secretion system C-terminal sorting domain-containing protein [Flexibacter flexilis DSM 6793]
MKKHLPFFLLLFVSALAIQSAKAQYITIPNASFRNFLKQQYPSCFNSANQLDTLCAAAAPLEGLIMQTPTDTMSSIEGIRYFKRLKSLNCEHIGLISLPQLPDSLTSLDILSNDITSIHSFPPNLELLYGPDNLNLSTLPPLPSTLQVLDMSTCNLQSLPPLPPSLTLLDLSNNPISAFPALPSSLTSLSCEFCSALTALPELPPNIEWLDIPETAITCLPHLPESLYLFIIDDLGTIKCLPNRPPGVYSELPLCNVTVENGSYCYAFPSFKGQVFVDENNNGQKDETERVVSLAKLTLGNNISFTDENGFYQIYGDSIGSSTLYLDVPAYYTCAQPSYASTFAKYSDVVTKDFPLTPINQNISDLNVSLNNITNAQIGQAMAFQIKVANAGTKSKITHLQFTKSPLFNVDSASVAGYVIDADTIRWDLGTLNIFDTKTITLYGTISATASTAELLVSSANVYANDLEENTPTDNYQQLILAISDTLLYNYNAATKTIANSNLANEYIDYSVHFQNISAETVSSVVIADTLDTRLLANTLVVTGSSGNMTVTVRDNILYFELLNHSFPSYLTNQLQSQGLVSFKIKANPTLSSGDTIRNKAFIYLDYDTMLLTNQTQTIITSPTSIATSPKANWTVYPNPAKGNETLHITAPQNTDVRILSMEGRVIQTGKINDNKLLINNLPKGLYLIESSNAGQVMRTKLVVQ